MRVNEGETNCRGEGDCLSTQPTQMHGKFRRGPPATLGTAKYTTATLNNLIEWYWSSARPT